MAGCVVFSCCLIMITNLFVAFDFAYAQPKRAFLVFGDSLADNGNNPFLLTTLRADFPPYGIDFPTHKPTGRFSNGLNIPDIISEQLGLEPNLPYLSPLLIDEKLLVGANFAFAGVGILNDTGIQFLHIIHIDKQLQLFDYYQQRLSAHIGAEEAKKLVNKALVLIILGGNDFVNNYYWVPFSARPLQFSLPDYVTYVISEYKKILKKFYDLGSRKVLVMGMGPMGCCIPVELALWSRHGDCDAELVRAASLYDRQFVEMIKELNTEIGDDVFIAVIAHKIFMDFVNNPQAFGFVTSKKACCGQGLYNGIGPCLPLSNLCQNRDLYAFWDFIHPSEKACRIIVQQILTGSNEYMYPMNLSTVLAMDPMV